MSWGLSSIDATSTTYLNLYPEIWGYIRPKGLNHNGSSLFLACLYIAMQSYITGFFVSYFVSLSYSHFGDT